MALGDEAAKRNTRSDRRTVRAKNPPSSTPTPTTNTTELQTTKPQEDIDSAPASLDN